MLGGRYEIRALLGRGGMGSVYRAHDRVVDEDVALKVLEGATASEEGAARWRSEIRLARQVTHPNVCRIHDCGEDTHLRWISMELVEGESVRHLLEGRGGLPEEEAWDLAVQVADGLAAVHRAGVVHRDLKTLNLTVDRAGRVRVMDFGIATPLDSADTGPTGYVLGSPEYISPEQARGRPADAGSDVYSLGIVVFELFAGEVPFRGPTPVETLLLHLRAAPPLDHPKLPAAVRSILARALSKEPSARFPSASEMADALRAASLASQERPARTTRRARRRLRWGLTVASLGAAAAVLWLAVPTSRSPTGLVPVPPQTPTPLTATPGPSERSEESPTLSPREPPDAPRRTAPLTPVEPILGGRPGPAASDVTDSSARETTPPATPPETGPTAEATGHEVPPRPEVPSLSRAPAAPSPTPAAGALLVVVRPWADVSVDGVPVGQTPLAAIPLEPGPHQILLTHPDYRPYPRRVTIRPGETLRLVVELPVDGVRRPR